MKIHNHHATLVVAKGGIASITQVALAIGLLTTIADTSWAQFQEKSPFEVAPQPTPPVPRPRFEEPRDTTDFVADRARAAGTDFLDQENLSLKADAELDFDAIFPEHEDDEFDAGGRIRVTFDGAHDAGDYFISGRAEGLFREDGDAAVDDAWMAFGHTSWDVQLGRFEAINLFPLGLDTIIVHAGDRALAPVYEANLARGRVGGSGGQIAFRYRPIESLRLEVDTIWGDPREGGENEGIGGVRPSVTFTQEPFSLTVGGEWVQFDLADDAGEADQLGAGATFRYDSGPILAHVNISYLQDDGPVNPGDTITAGANLIYEFEQGSFGKFLGIGVIHSMTDPDDSDLDPRVTTGYAAYVIPIFGFERATVTLAGSYSVADDAGPEEERGAFRARFNYAF